MFLMYFGSNKRTICCRTLATKRCLSQSTTTASSPPTPPTVPYDVTFLIINQKEEKLGEVHAHKFIFAQNSSFFSSFFRIKFYGAGDFADKTDKEVEITGSVKAFQLIKNYFYNQPTNIDELSVDKIFEVVALAHFYDIAKLEEALEKRLQKIVIENVMEAAKKAEEFARFERASQALLKNCARTLQAALDDNAKEFFEFSSQVAGTGDEVIYCRLLAMIKDLPPLPCSNCQKFVCLSGAEVTDISQFRLGTRITTNPVAWGQNHGHGRTEVVSVDASGGTLKVKAGEGTYKLNTGYDYLVKNRNGVFLFLFAC